MLSRLLGSMLLAGLLILPASAQTGGGFTVPLPAGDVFIPNDMPPDESGGG